MVLPIYNSTSDLTSELENIFTVLIIHNALFKKMIYF